MYATREVKHHTNRSYQEASLMRILSYEIADTNKGGNENTVCRRAKTRPQASLDNFQHRHDGLENTQVESASTLFPSKIKDPNIRPLPRQCILLDQQSFLKIIPPITKTIISQV